MTSNEIELDSDALRQTMALSGAHDAEEAVNIALRYYVAAQYAPGLAQHLERARGWSAVSHAQGLHLTEKAARNR